MHKLIHVLDAVLKITEEAYAKHKYSYDTVDDIETSLINKYGGDWNVLLKAFAYGINLKLKQCLIRNTMTFMYFFTDPYISVFNL